MKLIDDIGFDQSFSLRLFQTSRHAGRQPADDTPEAVKSARLKRLQDAINAQRAALFRRP